MGRMQLSGYRVGVAQPPSPTHHPPPPLSLEGFGVRRQTAHLRGIAANCCKLRTLVLVLGFLMK